jgi:hypothetical protein
MELPKLSGEFTYSGVVRRVNNITVEEEKMTLIGMEVMKDGKRSDKIKRYDLYKISPPVYFWKEDENGA